MANGKNSFMFYCDWQETFRELGQEKGYKLLMHLLDYVNDKDPKTDDVLIKSVFTLMKAQLKRDLKKWESRAETSRNNGALGGRPKKPKKPSGLKNNPEKPRKPVIVKVIDTVIDNILLEKESKEIFNEWVEYRKDLKKPIKSEKTLVALAKKINEMGFFFSEKVIRKSIENGWQGLFWKMDDEEKKPTINRQTEETIKSNLTGWEVPANK